MPGEPRERRGRAPSWDGEEESACGDSGVKREPPPEDLVGSRGNWRERGPEEDRVRAVDVAVPAIHLHTASVHDADRTVGGLEALGEVEFYLVGSALERALHARFRPLEHRVPGHDAGREPTRTTTPAPTPPPLP